MLCGLGSIEDDLEGSDSGGGDSLITPSFVETSGVSGASSSTSGSSGSSWTDVLKGVASSIFSGGASGLRSSAPRAPSPSSGGVSTGLVLAGALGVGAVIFLVMRKGRRA